MSPLLLYCYSAVSVFWVIHISLWKFRLPKYQIRALLILAATIYLLGSVLLLVTSTALEVLLKTTFFYWPVVLCYVITYSAVEGDSPTLSLMLRLQQSGKSGLSREEIYSFFAERPFIRARITALLHSSMVEERNGRYVLAGKPSIPFRIVLGFRKIFGTIPKGG